VPECEEPGGFLGVWDEEEENGLILCGIPEEEEVGGEDEEEEGGQGRGERGGRRGGGTPAYCWVGSVGEEGAQGQGLEEGEGVGDGGRKRKGAPLVRGGGAKRRKVREGGASQAV